MITDLSYLKSLSSNDNNFIREMADIFREQVGEYDTEMPELLSKKDYQMLSKVAHKAKSSVAVMGMNREADMLKELEIKAKEEIDTETYGKIIEEVLKNAHLAIEELDAYLS